MQIIDEYCIWLRNFGATSGVAQLLMSYVIGRQLTKHGMSDTMVTPNSPDRHFSKQRLSTIETIAVSCASRRCYLLKQELSAVITMYVGPRQDALMASCATQSLPLLPPLRTKLLPLLRATIVTNSIHPGEPILDRSQEQS